MFGLEVHKHLVALGLESPLVNKTNRGVYDATLKAFESIMDSLGLDTNDDSLRGTPNRIAKMYDREIFFGLDYNNFPKCSTFENKMQYDEMVAVEGITIQSMCEHHFLPFIGTATIAYIPSTKILGLSKFNRICEFFAHRPQVQERLTEQVAAVLRLVLATDDVAVVIRADHYCVKLRGARDTNSITITSKLSGKFREVPALREEFIGLTRKR